MSLAPPPRMPSPQLVPSPLPSPPIFARRVSSRSRLHLPQTLNEPPIPPRLVGSPLLEKLTHHQPSTMSSKAQQQLWFDGDEFGTRRSGPACSDSPLASPSHSPSSSPTTPRASRRAHRRSPSVAYSRRTRSHSPPPPPQSSVVPPVPPIPSSAFDTPGTRRPVLRTPPATPRAPSVRGDGALASPSPSRARTGTTLYAPGARPSDSTLCAAGCRDRGRSD
ncbi:hypothetical protein C8Q73DRAFT_340937 [Cubamyces lactineus]|nr:hypothetical protein C8Q73DRAFT_340937 [Cubamyces lactineus]